MNTPVLIVGAGPVGLTLACELTRYRVPVRIVDKAAQRTDKSKALVLWCRTLELLDRGDQGAAAFVEAGFKVRGVNIIAPGGHVVGHVKMDAVPGRINHTWFKANQTGVFYGQCSELCGARHAYMPIELHVVSDAAYAAWLSSAKKKYAALENDATLVASK